VRRQLQYRVVLSTRTGRLDFYYRIANTQGREPATAAFGGPPLRVTHRLAGLGTVLPRLGTRRPAPGALVTFKMADPPVSCAQHQETRFIFIRTPATAFHAGGNTQIIVTTGDPSISAGPRVRIHLPPAVGPETKGKEMVPNLVLA
jgi:hypothetical protein